MLDSVDLELIISNCNLQTPPHYMFCFLLSNWCFSSIEDVIPHPFGLLFSCLDGLEVLLRSLSLIHIQNQQEDLVVYL